MKSRYQVISGLAIIIGLVSMAGFGIVHSKMPPKLAQYSSTRIRSGDLSFGLFLRDLRKSNGILIAGTSESGNPIFGSNYWSLLATDGPYYLKRPVAIFAGAGRVPALWMPVLSRFGKDMRGMEFIYYINPVYFDESLNRPNEQYETRYLSSQFLEKESEAGTLPLAAFLPAISGKNDSSMESALASSLRYRLRKYSSAIPAVTIKTLLERSNRSPVAMPEIIDPLYGVSTWKLGRASILDISESDYTMSCIREFAIAAKNRGIRLTVLVGPFNSRLAQEVNPSAIESFNEVHENLISLLNEVDVKTIDAFDLSDVPSVFNDGMHLSAYGALKIAERVYEAERDR